MANKKPKKTMGKKDLKKTKGGLLPAVNMFDIQKLDPNMVKLNPNMVKIDYLK